MIKTKRFNLRFLALFFISAAIIGYELAVMRSFSIGSWSNFGSMVISIALLGFGLAGVILTFVQKHIRKAPNFWLGMSALAYMPFMALSHILAQSVPFSPVLISSDLTQIIWIGVYYIIYAVPFFIGAVFINLSFILFGSRMHSLYFWNMTGSGLGGILILLCMYIFSTDILTVPLLILTMAACILCFIRFPGNKPEIEPQKLGITIILFIISLSLILFCGKIRISEYKGVYIARQFPDSHLDYYSYSPIGEMEVYSSSYLHFAPGLSYVYSVNFSETPRNAFKGLYIDGNGPIGIMRKMDGQESAYMDYVPMSLPYLILDNPEVLLIKLGGGISAFTALYQGAEKITILESNTALIHMLKDVSLFKEYSDNLLENENISLVEGEPRAYCRSVQKKFDLVEISLIDSVGLNSVGGYSVSENYTYTVEAIKDYINTLSDNGLLSITVWNKLIIPRNVPKLLTTVVQALNELHIENPEKRIFVTDFYPFTSTILIKNSDFLPGEIDTLKKRCEFLLFNVCYYPGITRRESSFKHILKSLENYFVITDDENKSALNISTDEFYHHTMLWLLEEEKQSDLYDHYIFDIKPATDNRPYYTAYLKTDNTFMFLDQLNEVPEEWGYILLLGTFFQSILFGLFIIFIPLIGRWKELFKGKKGTAGIILYYACLGLGYMIIEIYLIQKLVYFLAEPIFSVSIVITSMLILSALGSLTAGKLKMDNTKKVRIAVLFIVAALVFYIFGLTPVINIFIGLNLFFKALLAIIFIAPAAFFMGMPYPTGLSCLEQNRNRLIPWALGMNGALSVTGSVLARLVSISAGFSVVLILSIILYTLAGIVFPANTKA
jgi:hypothetical protein